jgi:hypothetical protein
MLAAQGYTDDQQKALKDFRKTVLQLEIFPTRETIVFYEEICTENDSKQFPSCPLRFISFKQFKTLGRIPRYIDVHSYLEEITPEKHLNTLIVYVSHRWITDKSGIWQPDDSNSNNYKLIIEGLEKLWKNLAPWMEDCYLWNNYSCASEQSINQLSAAMGFSDCIFTPLHDEDYYPANFILSSLSLSNILKADPRKLPPNYSTFYSSPAWKGRNSSYLRQSVCRLEMFLGANSPFLMVNTEERMKKLIGKSIGLVYHRKMERRPHFLYGTKESKSGGVPYCLPPLTRSSFNFQLYDPRLGVTCSIEQEQLIRSFISECPSFPPKPETGYSGDDNHGTYFFEDGTIYEGKWLNGSFSGYGICYYPTGDYYGGEWKEGLRHGYGNYYYNNGEFFAGDWNNGNKQQGGYFYSNGDRYLGSWHNGKRVCYGAYSYFKDGCTYEGDWEYGRARWPGKFTFLSGDWLVGYGLSVTIRVQTPYRLKFTFLNGESYEGDWCKGKFLRSGEYTITMIGGYVLKGKYDLLGNAQFERRSTSFNAIYSTLRKNLPRKTEVAQETGSTAIILNAISEETCVGPEKKADEPFAVGEKEETPLPFRSSALVSLVSENNRTTRKSRNENSKIKPDSCVVC